MAKSDDNTGGGFDLQKAKEQFAIEKAKLEDAKKAFDGLGEQLTQQLREKLPSLLSDEEKETLDLDGDPVKQFDILFGKYKENVLDKLEQERAALEQFEDQLNQKALHIASLEAEEEFKKQNPDIDFDVIADWYENDLPNRAKQEIVKASNGDHIKFLELIKEAYEKQNGNATPAKDDEPKLPKDINKVAGTSGDLDKGSDDEADAASILFNR